MIPETPLLDKFISDEPRTVSSIRFVISSSDKIDQNHLLSLFSNLKMSFQLIRIEKKRFSRIKKYFYEIKFEINAEYKFEEYALFIGKMHFLASDMYMSIVDFEIFYE